MDHFFENGFHHDDYNLPIFRCDDNYYSSSLPVKQSAFVPYKNEVVAGFKNNSRINNMPISSSGNMNKRIIGFIKRSWPVKSNNNTNLVFQDQEQERERMLRHMMNERMRRERQKQSYLALHSMLPQGTKNDKKSIVETAQRRIQELDSHKKMLDRRNHELLAKLAVIEKHKRQRTNIQVRVSNPTSGIDSMLEVLKCVKKLGIDNTSIQSQLTKHELIAVLDTETQNDAREIENAVQITLQELERKLLW